MSREEFADGDGSPLVKEDQHQRVSADEGVSSRLRAANSITALIWERSRPSNQSIMSSMLAPASKFSKMTETGMRVPRSTQAPLTFPGTLSTAGHCDQSSAIFLTLFPQFSSKPKRPACQCSKTSKKDSSNPPK